MLFAVWIINGNKLNRHRYAAYVYLKHLQFLNQENSQHGAAIVTVPCICVGWGTVWYQVEDEGGGGGGGGGQQGQKGQGDYRRERVNGASKRCSSS